MRRKRNLQGTHESSDALSLHAGIASGRERKESKERRKTCRRLTKGRQLSTREKREGRAEKNLLLRSHRVFVGDVSFSTSREAERKKERRAKERFFLKSKRVTYRYFLPSSDVFFVLECLHALLVVLSLFEVYIHPTAGSFFFKNCIPGTRGGGFFFFFFSSSTCSASTPFCQQ